MHTPEVVQKIVPGKRREDNATAGAKVTPEARPFIGIGKYPLVNCDAVVTQTIGDRQEIGMGGGKKDNQRHHGKGDTQAKEGKEKKEEYKDADQDGFARVFLCPPDCPDKLSFSALSDMLLLVGPVRVERTTN